jgi:hypothetical protein
MSNTSAYRTPLNALAAEDGLWPSPRRKKQRSGTTRSAKTPISPDASTPKRGSKPPKEVGSKTNPVAQVGKHTSQARRRHQNCHQRRRGRDRRKARRDANPTSPSFILQRASPKEIAADSPAPPLEPPQPLHPTLLQRSKRTGDHLRSTASNPNPTI